MLVSASTWRFRVDLPQLLLAMQDGRFMCRPFSGASPPRRPIRETDMLNLISSPTDADAAFVSIGASHEPQLLLNAECVVIAASRSFCRSFDLDHAKTVGRRLIDLGIGE